MACALNIPPANIVCAEARKKNRVGANHVPARRLEKKIYSMVVCVLGLRDRVWETKA